MFLGKIRMPDFKRTHLNSFPCVQLKKLSKLDFFPKLAGEIVVLGFAGIVIVMNILFFWGKSAHTFSDNSYAAKFLSYHPEQNPKLNMKNNSIITKIAHENLLVSQAMADEISIVSPPSEPTNEDKSPSATFDEQGLAKPNPDSVSALVTKQIKVYETKPGDTLKSIATENGISVKTIMWTNNLSSENIKAGWFLLILPTDGVLHKATRNDTLPDVAKKYKGDLDRIIAYNALDNAEDIDEGQLVIIPQGSMPEAPKPKPKPNVKKPSTSQNRLLGKVRPDGTIEDVEKDYMPGGDEHIFPKGYCTWYVAQKVSIPWGGNAKNWLANAKAYGAIISNKPAVGTIVVTTDNKRYGHVALVTDVDELGFTVSEMNYEKFGKVNTRWIPKNSGKIRGFIHP